MATSSAAASVLVRPESIPPHPRRRGLLRNEPRGIRDRLLSIDRDVGFVHAVATLFARPVVANERCGSWYVRPGLKRGSSYFKSTDGHFGQCCFNLRRLNAHLLDIVVHGDGCIIVDSTRRGKSMPDALSKTIPIWCAVLNRTLFPGLVHSSDRAGVEEYHRLYTPPDCISASEDSQIEARIDGFVESLKELDLDVLFPQTLRERLKKPLRPAWVTPATSLPASVPDYSGFYPIILCTASRTIRSSGETASRADEEFRGISNDFTYIQGAGDDSEAWACGLTPQLFWQHKDELLRTAESDLPSLISKIRPSTSSVQPSPSLLPELVQSISHAPDGGASGETSHPAMIRIKPTASLYLVQPSLCRPRRPSTLAIDQLAASTTRPIILISCGVENTEPNQAGPANGKTQHDTNPDSPPSPATAPSNTSSHDEATPRIKTLHINSHPSKKQGHRAFEQEFCRLEAFLASALSSSAGEAEPLTLVVASAGSSAANIVAGAACQSLNTTSRLAGKVHEAGDVAKGGIADVDGGSFDNDMCLAVALVIACLLYDDDGSPLKSPPSRATSQQQNKPSETHKQHRCHIPPGPVFSRPRTAINKAFIRTRLSWLTTSLFSPFAGGDSIPMSSPSIGDHVDPAPDCSFRETPPPPVETPAPMLAASDIKDTQPSRRILRVVHGFLMPRPTATTTATTAPGTHSPPHPPLPCPPNPSLP